MKTVLALMAVCAVVASGEEAIVLWPAGAPHEKAQAPQEKAQGNNGDVRYVGNPRIRIFRPAPGIESGAGVIVFPGGGYNHLAVEKEGTEICQWLNSIGVTGVLLEYRVPRREGRPPHAAPLEDAQRAMGIVRSRAGEWRLDIKRIGVLGFSAGGHLVAALSNNFEKRTYDPLDAADAVSCRPDFALLIYPAYLTLKQEGNKLAPELAVTANTPPSFLVQTEDDGVRVENSLFYYLALKNAGVPGEMHLFSSGRHGYGLRSDLPVGSWPRRAEEWMRSVGVLPATLKQ
jgi:acetyl esterase/lipase